MVNAVAERGLDLLGRDQDVVRDAIEQDLHPLAPGPELPDAVHAVALTALGHGFNLAYLVCAVAALVAAVLTFVGLAGVRHHHAAVASPSAADAGTVD